MAKYFDLALTTGKIRSTLKLSGKHGLCKSCGGPPHCANRTNEGIGGVYRAGYGPKGKGAGRPDCKTCTCPKCSPQSWTEAELRAIGYKD